MWSTRAWGQAWLWGCPPQSVPAQEMLSGSLDRELPGPDSAPAKIHQGPAPSVPRGKRRVEPSQPRRRRFSDPGQVNLCPMSPLQGQEAFISSATPQPGPGAAPRGRGAPRSHPGCHSPTPCSLLAGPHTPLRAACPPGGAGSRSPRGVRVGLGEPRTCSAEAPGLGRVSPGWRGRGGAGGAAHAASCDKLLGVTGGVGGSVCVCARHSRVLGFIK